jgi:hypothetical protein
VHSEDEELRFEFKGPIPNNPKVISSLPKLLSEDNLRLILVRAWTIGRLIVTNHFREMGRKRNFDVLDAELAVRRGKMRGEPEYCPEFSNWKCRMFGLVEDKLLEVVVALDDFGDYDECPLIILVTGYWKE